MVFGAEKCDDFGIGPGCFNCQIVPGYACVHNGTQSVCDRMNSRISLSMISSHSVAVCGDGLVVGYEGCDDGVTPPASGDGCSDTCQLEEGWVCSYDSMVVNKSVCVRMSFLDACFSSFSRLAFCGDGFVRGNETCDDFFNVGNGCSLCQVENGYSCPHNGTQSVCSRMLPTRILDSQFSLFSHLLAICGDGIILDVEQCDKLVQIHGCDGACNAKVGYYCTSENETSGSCTGMFF